MQLQEKEKILWQNKPKNSVLAIWFFSKVLLSTFIFGFLLFWATGFFGGMYLAAYHPEINEDPLPYVLSFFKIILPIFVVLTVIYNILLVKTYNYYITNQRIIFEGGIIIRKKKNIPYHKITDTSANQNIIEKMLGISSLEIFTAGTGMKRAEVNFAGLEDAENPQNLINKTLKSLKSTGE